MAAYFFDIDGTVVHYHTGEWLSGAKEMLIYLHKKSHQIIFTTKRGPQDKGTPWSMEKTREMLDELGFEYQVLFNIDSPRVMINDKGVRAVRRKKDKLWTAQDIQHLLKN